MLYRVIIADDEPFIREGLKKLISWDEYGLEIIGCVEDGAKALELLEKESADICITDIRMPHMDGLELMQRCKNAGKKMKYIILSGYTDFELVKRAAQIGIENYIVKPIDKMELNQTLVSVVDKLNNEHIRQSVMKEGIDIFRENLIYRWVTGKITQAELEERKEYLGVVIDSDYAVGILKIAVKNGRCYSFAELNNIKQEALEKIRNFIAKREKIVCVPDFSGNLLLVFTEINNRQSQIRDVLNRVIRYSEFDSVFRCFIAVGSIEDNTQKIDKSYFAARYVLENYGFNSGKQAVWYKDISEYLMI